MLHALTERVVPNNVFYAAVCPKVAFFMTYKILWCSLHSLYDSSDDAMIYSKSMLEALTHREISVVAINAFASEDGQGLENLEKAERISEDNHVLHLKDNDINYFVVQTLNHK